MIVNDKIEYFNEEKKNEMKFDDETSPFDFGKIELPKLNYTKDQSLATR